MGSKGHPLFGNLNPLDILQHLLKQSLEKKKQNRDKAASRTQVTKNHESYENINFIEQKKKDDLMNEYEEVENVNNSHKYEYDYDFDSDNSENEYDETEDSSTENSDKPEYYYYYYYDYMDSGIDISHELSINKNNYELSNDKNNYNTNNYKVSNNVAAQYEPLPTPLWQVGGKLRDGDDVGGNYEDCHKEYETTISSRSVLSDEDSDSPSDITGDKDDVTEEISDDTVVI